MSFIQNKKIYIKSKWLFDQNKRIISPLWYEINCWKRKRYYIHTDNIFTKYIILWLEGDPHWGIETQFIETHTLAGVINVDKQEKQGYVCWGIPRQIRVVTEIPLQLIVYYLKHCLNVLWKYINLNGKVLQYVIWKKKLTNNVEEL